MKSQNSSASVRPTSSQPKRNTSSASATLAPSEIARLRRVQKTQIDSALEAFSQTKGKNTA